MARDVLVGIVVSARDAASATLAKIANSGRALGSNVDAAATKASAALNVMEKSANLASSAMQIGEKISRALGRAYELTVGASLAQRSEHDLGRVALENHTIAAQHFAAKLGDVLLPIILGVADAFKPLLTAGEAWLTQNKRTVGSGLIEFLRDAAQALTAGVATGTLLVTRAWSGWGEMVSAVKSLALTMFAEVVDGSASLLGTLQDVAGAFGADGLATSIGDARDSVAAYGRDTRASADLALASAAEQVRAQAELEQKIQDVSDAIATGIGAAASAAYDRLGASIRRVPTDLEQQRIDRAKAAAEKWDALWQEGDDQFVAQLRESLAVSSGHLQAWVQNWGEAQTRMASLTEEKARAQQAADDLVYGAATENLAKLGDAWALYNARRGEQTDAANREIVAKLTAASRQVTDSIASDVEGYAQSIRGILISTIRDAVQSGADAAKVLQNIGAALGNMVLEEVSRFVVAEGVKAAARKVTATQNITANAAEAASSAAIPFAAIPFVGIALAVAAAATMFAAVSAFAGKFHAGGVIPGRPGEERLAILKAGELVVDERRAGAAQAAGFGPLGSAGASAGAGRGGGGGRTDLTLRTLLPSRVEVDSTNRRVLLKSTKRGQRLGWGV